MPYYFLIENVLQSDVLLSYLQLPLYAIPHLELAATRRYPGLTNMPYPFCFAFKYIHIWRFFLNACMHFWSSIYLVVLFCLSRIELFYDGDLLIFLLSYSHKRFWVDFSIPSLYWLWFLELFFLFFLNMASYFLWASLHIFLVLPII